MKTLQLHLLFNERWRSVGSFWGIDSTHFSSGEALHQELVRRMSDPLAARFVWEYLNAQEQIVLWYCLGKKTREGVIRSKAFEQTHLPSRELFDTAVESLIRKLLIEEGDAPLAEETTLYAYGESAEALYTTGRELFFAGAARTHLEIEKLLPALDKTALWQLIHWYRLAPLGLSSTYDLRQALAGALADEEIMEEVLAKPEMQSTIIPSVITWLITQNGHASIPVLKNHFSLTDEQLYRLLHMLEENGIAFDTLTPEREEQRQLFVPLARLSPKSTLSTPLLTREKSEALRSNMQIPSVIAEGIPRTIYAIAVIINAIYQQRIDLTSALRVAERCAKQLNPRLQMGRSEREDDEGFTFLDLLFRTLYHLHVIDRQDPLLMMSRLPASYSLATELSAWKNRDAVEQTHILLEEWKAGKIWKDIVVNFRQWDMADWHPEHGRSFLLSMLKECQPGLWYSIDDFLSEIWELRPYIMRPSLADRVGGLHTTTVLKARWWQADGAFLRGCLSSTLWELGIVSLGTNTTIDSLSVPAHATAFQLTDLGVQVLRESCPLVRTVASEHMPPLLVAANFEVHLLGEDLPTLYALLPWSEVEHLSQASHLRFSAHSIQRGVHHGLHLEHLLAFLEQRGGRELPQNVVYSMREWASKYTEVQVAQGVILVTSNEAGAARLAQAPTFRGFGLLRIAPCVLVAPFHINILELRKILEKEQMTVRLVSSLQVPVNEAEKKSIISLSS